MEDVSDVSTCELDTSAFVRPFRLKYKQDGHDKVWDCVYTHRSVFIIVYNTSRKKLVLVRQFRPSVYFNAVRSEKGLTADDIGKPLDTSSVPASRGMCIELCAGIIDKDIGELEIARSEVKEECGYDVPHSNIRQIQSFPGSVGISGERMTMFYAEVTDAMKSGSGGGLAEEGELIEVVEMTVEEVRKLLAEPEVNATPVALYGLMWFLAHKSL